MGTIKVIIHTEAKTIYGYDQCPPQQPHPYEADPNEYIAAAQCDADCTQYAADCTQYDAEYDADRTEYDADRTQYDADCTEYDAGPTQQQSIELCVQKLDPVMDVSNNTVIHKQPSDDTCTILSQEEKEPCSYFALALVTTFFFNPIFGLIAIVVSFMSSSEAELGNYESARRQGRISMWISISGIIVGAVFFTVFGIVFAVLQKNYRFCDTIECLASQQESRHLNSP